MTGGAAEVPAQVRLALSHAAVQTLADDHGVDLLHIKGLALDAPLVWSGRESTDVDVLVRPSQVRRFVQLLRSRGWRVVTSFENGSAFEHSTTLWHDHWQHLDVHRAFPGIDREPERSFDLLWQDRGSTLIAGRPCDVPSELAQALVLLLHAARSGRDPRAALDIGHIWESAPQPRRTALARLADDLGGTVAFSVIAGDLEAHRTEPEYALWKVWSTGGTRLDEWIGRVKAAPTTARKVRVLGRSLMVNVEHLQAVRQRPVTRAEILVEFFARPLRGIREEARRRSASGRDRP